MRLAPRVACASVPKMSQTVVSEAGARRSSGPRSQREQNAAVQCPCSIGMGRVLCRLLTIAPVSDLAVLWKTNRARPRVLGPSTWQGGIGQSTSGCMRVHRRSWW